MGDSILREEIHRRKRPPENGMNPTQKIALSKALTKAAIDNARDQLGVGVHNVDFTVNVKGTLKVGDDYDVAPTVSIPLKQAMAAIIVYAGLHTSEAALASIADALYDQLENTGGKSGDAIKQAIPMVDAALAIVEQRLIAKLPRQYRRGVVTPRLQVTEVVPEEAEQIAEPMLF
jgi:hypothetical protein